MMKLLCAFAVLAALACGDGQGIYTGGDVARAYFDRIQAGDFQGAMEFWDAESGAAHRKWGLAWPQALAKMQRDYGSIEDYELYSKKDSQAGSGERLLKMTYLVHYERRRVSEAVVVRIPSHENKNVSSQHPNVDH